MRDLQLKDNYPAELNIDGGQLRVSGSLYNLVYLLLFGVKSALNDYMGYSLDSKIPDLQRENLTNKTRLDIIEEAKRVLSVLITRGIAEEIEVDAIIPAPGKIALTIRTYQPDNDLQYQLNWGETGI